MFFLKRLALIFLIISVHVYGDNRKNDLTKSKIIQEATLLDTKFNIDKKIILAYIATESNFNFYPIAIKTNDPTFLNKLYIHLGYKTKRKGKYVSIYPKDYDDAEFAYDLMALNKELLQIVDYDLGVMQINTRNIKRYGINEKETYLNYKENMLYGADIIRGCYETLKNKTKIENILECYNRGSNIKHLNRSDRSYLNRFIENYQKL
ncbi:transglycosylase SLT domain-containing protein [Campylobacter sp. JMF_03 NE3]|uniref:transglycosylase SLT domain-containing protein n=1 Tax=Campylobacter sp. JMF_03 NE3 TaxID=2983831 RepID=UPI0022E9A33A|nr:transglycosylase SLT domain-containing protein [Campylobacter sp. JMF_03 NE3]MDA3053540.1 transglycosylase SLT domain-containing protein [Campylobacter sp. JMF_03 NE3]